MIGARFSDVKRSEDAMAMTTTDLSSSNTLSHNVALRNTLQNNVGPNESNPSVPIRTLPITLSKLYIRHAKLTHCINRIAKERQYVVGNNVILPAWSR